MTAEAVWWNGRIIGFVGEPSPPQSAQASVSSETAVVTKQVEVIWWNGRILMPPPPPQKTVENSAPLPQRRMTQSPYHNVVDALRQCRPEERVDFYESVGALRRSADCDGAYGLLRLRTAYCRGSSPLDRALAAEWKRQFLSPRFVARVERNWPHREEVPDVLAEIS